MKIDKILVASSLDELRKLSSYLEIKTALENSIGNKIGINGWESLFNKIQNLRKTVLLNKNILINTCDKKSFKNAKREISKALEINVTAKGWSDLKKKVNLIIDLFFPQKAFDPYEYYEKTKLKKFKDSSKLEGIDLELASDNTSLENVLAKYKR